jgi:hypothetical protein
VTPGERKMPKNTIIQANNPKKTDSFGFFENAPTKSIYGIIKKKGNQR